MGWLFALMVTVALLVFGTLPFWVSVGYAIVIAWCGWLLYSIFLRPDPLSREIRRHAPDRNKR